MDLSKISRRLSLHGVAAALTPWSPWSSRVEIDYASGSHHRGEIEGLAAARIAIGVSAVVELKPDSISALIDLAGTGIPVFLDSGAFAEIDRQGVVRKPITDALWHQKLGLYMVLASALGEQLSVVAPDRVGDQGETLLRLARYRHQMAAVAAAGARVLVPVQRGRVEPATFFGEQCDALGFEAVPALPLSAKVGMPPKDVAVFLGQVGARDVHLLGMGGRNRRLDAVLDAIEGAAPYCRVTIDSNKLLALRGRGGGRGDPRAARPALYFGSGWGDPVTAEDRRKLDTVEADRAAAELEEVAWEGEYTDLIGSPSEWLSTGRLREVAEWMGLGGVDEFVRDPEGWLQQDRRWELPEVSGALDRAWVRYRFEATGVQRKASATERTMTRLKGPLRGRPEGLRVGLIACSATKLPVRSAARSLYSASSLFSGARGWVEGQGIPWFILSAKHGLLSPEQMVDPYSERLPSGRSPRRVRQRGTWARQVVQQLHDQLGSLQGVVFELHAGSDYASPLVRLLGSQGALVEQPLDGLQIGERLAWYKNRR